MIVNVILNIAGPDSGPFDLYSDVDGYSVPFEVSIPKSSLEAGYISYIVPDDTTIIRIKSTGTCVNYLDVVIVQTAGISCNTTESGTGPDIEYIPVDLDSSGGIVIFEVDGNDVPNKFEIMHLDVKKATSGMTVPNEGPFDNVYGLPVIPTYVQALATDQFIGTDSGSIPDRNTTFLSETGITGITVTTGQQLLWWEYTTDDYFLYNQAMMRVTSPIGGTWDVIRRCPTTTTTTTLTPSTTTTTTTVIHYGYYSIAPQDTDIDTCPLNEYLDMYYAATDNPIVGTVIHRTPELDSPLIGNNKYYKMVPFDSPIEANHIVLQIDDFGVVLSVYFCS